MDSKSNSLNWFEIPAGNISRAQKFYETIFGVQMVPMGEMMGMKMVGFPMEQGNGKAAGGLVESQMHKPSVEGAVVYLNANPSMDPVIARVEAAGGKLVMPKTQITPEIGYMAFIIDSEGNKVGLHSQK